MKRSPLYKTGKARVLTFKRWINKGYAAFLSLGKLIRIGRLKVVMSGTLSSKAKIIKKGLIALSSLLFSPGAMDEEEDGGLSYLLMPAGGEGPATGYGLITLWKNIRETNRGEHPCCGRKNSGTRKWLPGKFPVLGIIFLFGSTGLCAQSDSTIVLDEVSITGNRILIPFDEASRNIAVVEQRQILTSPVQSLPEILEYVPGVDVRQRGPVGVQADISIRGGTYEQTLVLVNGIKMTDPQTGHHAMSLPFNMDDVVRIEVLKGPGARLYGPNAFAGAVNFITAIPEEKKVLFRGYGGSFGSLGGGISVAMPSRRYGQYFSLGGDISGGYRYNTDYKKGNAFYQSELPTGKGKLSFTGGWTGKKFGANGFYASPAYKDQYEEVKTFLTGISWESGRDIFRYQARIYWRGNQDRYFFIRGKPDFYENFHRTHVFGAEWNGSIETGAGITGVGLEYRKEMIRGEWVRDEAESKSNLDGLSRDLAGLYLEQKMDIGGKIDLTPGMYLSWYPDFGWNVFPGVDMGYGINRYWRIYANAGMSYRVPTFYEQYYQSPAEQGNPDLMPERAGTFEAGVRYGKHALIAEANVFYRLSGDLIDWVYSPSDSIWKAGNIRTGRTWGAELSVTLDFNAYKERNGWLESFSFSYNYIHNRLGETEPLLSRYALDNLRHQLIAGLNVRIFRKLKNSFKFRFIERIDQDPYVLIDDRLYWEQNEKLSIFLEGTNLTDQSYTEVMTPMPGRWIRTGIIWQIGL